MARLFNANTPASSVPDWLALQRHEMEAWLNVLAEQGTILPTPKPKPWYRRFLSLFLRKPAQPWASYVYYTPGNPRIFDIPLVGPLNIFDLAFFYFKARHKDKVADLTEGTHWREFLNFAVLALQKAAFFHETPLKDEKGNPIANAFGKLIKVKRRDDAYFVPISMIWQITQNTNCANILKEIHTIEAPIIAKNAAWEQFNEEHIGALRTRLITALAKYGVAPAQAAARNTALQTLFARIIAGDSSATAADFVEFRMLLGREAYLADALSNLIDFDNLDKVYNALPLEVAQIVGSEISTYLEQTIAAREQAVQAKADSILASDNPSAPVYDGEFGRAQEAHVRARVQQFQKKLANLEKQPAEAAIVHPVHGALDMEAWILKHSGICAQYAKANIASFADLYAVLGATFATDKVQALASRQALEKLLMAYQPASLGMSGSLEAIQAKVHELKVGLLQHVSLETEMLYTSGINARLKQDFGSFAEVYAYLWAMFEAEKTADKNQQGNCFRLCVALRKLAEDHILKLNALIHTDTEEEQVQNPLEVVRDQFTAFVEALAEHVSVEAYILEMSGINKLCGIKHESFVAFNQYLNEMSVREDVRAHANRISHLKTALDKYVPVETFFPMQAKKIVELKAAFEERLKPTWLQRVQRMQAQFKLLQKNFGKKSTEYSMIADIIEALDFVHHASHEEMQRRLTAILTKAKKPSFLSMMKFGAKKSLDVAVDALQKILAEERQKIEVAKSRLALELDNVLLNINTAEDVPNALARVNQALVALNREDAASLMVEVAQTKTLRTTKDLMPAVRLVRESFLKHLVKQLELPQIAKFKSLLRLLESGELTVAQAMEQPLVRNLEHASLESLYAVHEALTTCLTERQVEAYQNLIPELPSTPDTSFTQSPATSKENITIDLVDEFIRQFGVKLMALIAVREQKAALYSHVQLLTARERISQSCAVEARTENTIRSTPQAGY